VWGKHPLYAAANRPASSGVGGLAGLHASKVDGRVGITPRRAALEIEQPGRRHRVAETARQRVEPAISEIDRAASERTESDGPAFAVARPVDHIADADHPATTELIVAANLTAAREARTVRRYFTATERHTGVTECSADVAADVASGPRHWRRRRRQRRRGLPR